MPLSRKPGTTRTFLAEPALYDCAIKALGRRMRTEFELRRILTAKAEPGERGQAAIKSALARLKEHGYLSDAAYAETFARLRQENDKLGSRRVRQKLAAKGVPSRIAQQAIDDRYAATDEVALAREHLARKRIGKPENEKETARVVRRLAAAGFSSGVIYKVLREWNLPDESLAAVETLDEEASPE
jgi:regulatory protein